MKEAALDCKEGVQRERTGLAWGGRLLLFCCKEFQLTAVRENLLGRADLSESNGMGESKRLITQIAK